jgi:hypothetical protein
MTTITFDKIIPGANKTKTNTASAVPIANMARYALEADGNTPVDQSEKQERVFMGMKEYLHKRKYDEEPNCAFKLMRMDALQYYYAEQQSPSHEFQMDVLWAMYLHPDCCDGWKEFVSERI